MTIIDCHVHTWDWLGLTGGEGPGYWDRCLAWAERLDATYVVSCVKAIGRRLNEEPDPAFVHAANQEAFEFVQHMKGRAVGLCYVNPRDQAAALDEMEEWIGRRGFLGLKLLTSVPCNDPLLDPLVDWCARHRIFVCQHTWSKALNQGPHESTPAMFATLAARHPDATMVMYHSGGDFTYGAKAARGLPNAYCDIGGADAVDGVLDALVDAVGADHVVFGSDLPGRALTSQLAKVYGARLSGAEKEQILYGNMARILAAARGE